MASESSELRQEAITALIALCPLVVNDAHVAKFQQLVPRLLQVKALAAAVSDPIDPHLSASCSYARALAACHYEH